MKLEIGMYVRSKVNGNIGKIVKIEELVNEKDVLYYELDEINSGIGFCSTEIDSVKASHNIIDLVEEKDFCEIEFYSLRYEKRVTRVFQIDYIIEDNICFENGHCQLNILHGKWSNEDNKLNPIIKRILTHDEFEREAYKVE